MYINNYYQKNVKCKKHDESESATIVSISHSPKETKVGKKWSTKSGRLRFMKKH